MKFDESRVVLVACAMCGGDRVLLVDVKEKFQRMRVEIADATLYTRIKTLENEGLIRLVGRSPSNGRPFVLYGLTEEGRAEVERVKYAMAIALQAFLVE